MYSLSLFVLIITSDSVFLLLCWLCKVNKHWSVNHPTYCSHVIPWSNIHGKLPGRAAIGGLGQGPAACQCPRRCQACEAEVSRHCATSYASGWRALSAIRPRYAPHRRQRHGLEDSDTVWIWYAPSSCCTDSCCRHCENVAGGRTISTCFLRTYAEKGETPGILHLARRWEVLPAHP